ncbi:toll/interleukin-1 receptor domain-containing protein [Methylomonas rivi]|uniref:TIR domain-containing protein n=1 Tax=Methylomonas rivi TaxID=2952226 RepID=A0ABT1U9Y4_9GAMM|nr:toll/interleukin-1 receptor domain-containing protein [Methylomonas sp. WSC-6]MCQ8130672.1 TIR domain-containing protein [Methylomonas sp. WSC-6]
MTYQHDVFISYRRQELWTPWTRDHFKKLLKAYLQQELQIEPDIFVDERIQVGADWINALGEHLATSKVMVAIFSGDYFASDWCLHELDLMLARAQQAATGKPNYQPLVIPVVVHDGQFIPEIAKRIQPADMAKFRVAFINEATADYQEFSKAMGQLAPAIASAISKAPVFQDEWIAQYQERFDQLYQASLNNQHVEPLQFVAKRPTPPTVSPKLTF